MESSVLVGLKKGELWKQRHYKGHRVFVEGGSLWLTEEGDSRDFLLRERCEHSVQSEGLVVVQALCDSKIRMQTGPIKHSAENIYSEESRLAS